MNGQSCRDKVLRWTEDGAGAQCGLLLDRALRIVATGEGHSEERTVIHQAAIRSLKATAGLYEAAFRRRLEWVETLKGQCAIEAPIVATPEHQRLVIGLGNSSPLETGLTLHRTYGVPIIPGSALKGIAASSIADRKERELLFGGTDDAGFVTCHDAWILPGSLTSTKQGLLCDVITPHHSHYYDGKHYSGGSRQGQIIPPTDLDDPNPVSFLSVRGRFHIVLTCEDPSADGKAWLRRARDILLAVLKDSGVGGKGASGYGRLEVVSTS
jgi:CRISPR-associated protein Cmr6